MTKEELESKLKSVGIIGRWVNEDKYGFSRTYEFMINEQVVQIEWYVNYSTIIISNFEYWFDRITTDNTYPVRGKWIEFRFGEDKPLHLNVGGINNELL